MPLSDNIGQPSEEETKQKKLHYRRSVWDAENRLRDSDGSLLTLQDTLLLLHERFIDVVDRTFEHHGAEIKGLQWRSEAGLFLGHLTRSYPGQSALLVPDTDPGQERASREEIDPPERRAFLNGDLFFAVFEDHLVYCSNGNCRLAALLAYLEQLAEAEFESGLSGIMRFAAEITPEFRKTIRRGDVKSVVLQSSVARATLYREERERDLGPFSMRWIRNSIPLLAQSDDLSTYEWEALENSRMSFELDFDGRKKSGGYGEASEVVESFAENVLNSSEELYFKIKGSEKVITPEETRLQSTAHVPLRGNSIDREATWLELRDFLYGLLESGQIES